MKQKSFSGNAGQSQRRNKAVLSALPLPLLLAAIVLTSFFIYASRVKANEQRLCGSIAAAASRSVAASLAGALDHGRILSDALSQNSSLGKDQIADLSARILGSAAWVSGVTTAPNAVIKYHYPAEDNDSAIGHDMLSNPDRSYALTLAAGTKAPVISGPYESVDNKRNFFIRYPVFHKDTLWGFTSVTIDYDAWIKSLDLEGTYPGMSFAISRKQDDYSSTSDIQASVPGALVQEIPVQGGAVWLLQAKPARGWSTFDPFLFVVLVAGLTASVLLFLIVYRAQCRLLVARGDMRCAPSSGGVEDVPSPGDVPSRSASDAVSMPSMIVLANGERVPESSRDRGQPAGPLSARQPGGNDERRRGMTEPGKAEEPATAHDMRAVPANGAANEARAGTGQAKRPEMTQEEEPAAVQSMRRTRQQPSPASSQDSSAGSQGASPQSEKEEAGSRGAKGDGEVAEQAELPKFKGSDVPGKIFMPESPVKGNFASLLRKVAEQEPVASDSRADPLRESESEPVSEAPAAAMTAAEPPAASAAEIPAGAAVKPSAPPKTPSAEIAGAAVSLPAQTAAEAAPPEEVSAPEIVGLEPSVAPDRKRSRTTQQEMLFPIAEEPAPGASKPHRKSGISVTPAHEQVAARQNTQRTENPASALSVLVVDDSEANRDIMDHMLEFHGHRPDLASSGEQALDLCAGKPYDLIFMDCFMPGLDGYRTTQMLRSRFPDSGKKIIGMSARLGEQELRRCLDAGMDDLLAKPFTLKELDAIIKKHCG